MEANFNLALLDPPKFGWTATGNVENIITPHEDLKRRLRKGRRRKGLGVHSFASKSSANQTKTTTQDNEGNTRDIIHATEVSDNIDVKEKTHLEITSTESQKLTGKEYPPKNDQACPIPSSSSQGFKSVELVKANDYTVLRVKPMQNGGILDIYTYHYGREGLEMIEELEPNDTGTINWVGPKSIKPEILIEFPLGCGEMWSETLSWNLEDENTLTPLAFATNIAENFGLDFGATMDLAKSIESQLYAAVRSGDAYPETAATLRDYSTGRYRDPVRSHYSKWYGTTDQPGNGGFPTLGQPKSSKASQPIGANKVKNLSRSTSIKPNTTTASTNKFVFRTEKVYRDEVIKRAQRECKVAWSSTQLQMKSNQTCHRCQSKQSHCIAFACGNAAHCYCHTHMESVLDITKINKSEMTLDYCPICCLSCSCLKCRKKLDAVAFEFQKRTLSQKTQPSETSFENMLALCSMERAIPRANTLNKQSVPKVPRTHFPAELCGGRDLEPGSDVDYRTVFTAQGAYLLPPTSLSLVARVGLPAPPPSLQRDTSRVEEDGNVDYCQECRKTGNLLCCDYCPRAFHKACMTGKENNQETAASKWECYVCRQEKVGFPEDKVTGNQEYENGKACIDAICEAFASVKAGDKDSSEDYLKLLRGLGIILEMIRHLIEYDFGRMFQEPVDLAAVPQYATIVKNPMDLGTISTRLVNGHYAKLYQEGGTIDGTLVQVLKDLELIWHNCYSFNLEGSSIYRMAQVLSRRCNRMLQVSLDETLWNDSVKSCVSTYEEECNNERNAVSKKTTSSSFCQQEQEEHQHKLEVNWAPGGNTRIIAVFDPETGLVVKLYTTLKAACLAANYLTAEFGHASEWIPLSDYTIKNSIKKGKDDPKLTLFGYRWMYFDELRLNQVKFGEIVQNALDDDWLLKSPSESDDSYVQIMNNNNETSYIFLSIAEALSCKDLPKDVPLDELMNRLQQSPLNEWVSLAGLRWRKFLTDGSHKNNCNSKSDGILLKPATNFIGKSSTDGTTTTTTDAATTSTTTNKRKHVAFFKEDTCSGRKLVGFDTIQAAYEDWSNTIALSPLRQFYEHQITENISSSSNNSQEEFALEVFRKDYLQGKRLQIDGILWSSSALRQKEKQKIRQEKALFAIQTELSSLAKPSTMKSDLLGKGTKGKGTKRPAIAAAARPDSKKQKAVMEGEGGTGADSNTSSQEERQRASE